MVQAFLRSDLVALRHERSTDTVFWSAPVAPLGPEARAAAETLVAFAGKVLSPGEPFVAGQFTPADADLALMLHRLVANGDPCPDRLAAYARTIFARPSVREWLSHTGWKDR
jgi:glutathione S-transferase